MLSQATQKEVRGGLQDGVEGCCRSCLRSLNHTGFSPT